MGSLAPYNPKSSPSNRSKIILVTGLNGYIASHVAHILLTLDYTVRGTSRRSDTLDKIENESAFAAYKGSNQLQHVVVPDMTLPGAFDKAVADVHAIIHVASPIDFANTKSTDDFVLPAVRGVFSILDSAMRENAERGGQIKSFVLTSSVAAVVDRWRHPSPAEGGKEVHHYTEADWNESSEKVARESETARQEGRGPFLAPVAYGASKARAERAMWEFDSTHQTKGFVCTSINPAVVTGPPVLWPDSPAGLNETLMPVWKIWSGQSKKEGKLPPQIGGAGYIDVRDVALAHIWAALNPDVAGGERYLVSNGKAPPQAIADVIRNVYGKDNKVLDKVIMGEPGKGYTKDFGYPADENDTVATKILQALGKDKFMSFEQSVIDTIEGFKAKWGDVL